LALPIKEKAFIAASIQIKLENDKKEANKMKQNTRRR